MLIFPTSCSLSQCLDAIKWSRPYVVCTSNQEGWISPLVAFYLSWVKLKLDADNSSNWITIMLYPEELLSYATIWPSLNTCTVIYRILFTYLLLNMDVRRCFGLVTPRLHQKTPQHQLTLNKTKMNLLVHLPHRMHFRKSYKCIGFISHTSKIYCSS